MLRYVTLHAIFAAALLALLVSAPRAWAGANPNIPFYGYGAIVPDPAYPIVGENTHFTVTLGNSGDVDATNVQVKLSYNDWGVTFWGWQEIDTVTIPLIPAGGTATAEYDFVFENRAHTCAEALIVGADEDTNPNDDRGQINLEVINAGTEFVYGVPIVNNGDVPLHLQIVGHCGDDPAGAPDRGECKPVDARVELQPGEEMLVPVELHFPPDTAPGTVVEFQVDAFDVNNPGNPDGHNHVVLRVVFETARHLKTVALQHVNAAGAQTNSRPLGNRLDAVANHIDKALDDALWLDGSRLKPNGGSRVFAQELAAANALITLLSADLPLTLKVELDKVLRSLVDADRILAQTAIVAVSGDPYAEDLLADGDAYRLAGEYAEAIESYHAAWQAAMH
ncbi:MAG: CARDB domain-containing protein [Armatimonadota bacterium]